MALFPSDRRNARPVGVLDIGTSKTCCLIGRTGPVGVELMGIGHQRSAGLKSGMVTAPDDAEQSVRAAVAQAERMAGIGIDEVVLAVSCGRLRAQTFTARAPVGPQAVREADIARILGAGESYLERSGRAVVHLMRSDWRLDGAGEIADPRGLAGRELAVDLTAVTADEGPTRNLVHVVERGHLAVTQLIAAPFASALAVATEEELQVGALVIDIGAGLTSFAVFADGRLVHLDSVPVGGQLVTFDVARALVAPVAEAERIKTLYGTLIKAASNDGEVFAYAIAGEDEGVQHQTSKAFVHSVIEPRMAGILDLVVERLHETGFDAGSFRRVVLTGGASQLIGLEQAWGERLQTAVRIGRPRGIGRMPQSMCSPAFSTVIGLMTAAARPGAAIELGLRNEVPPDGRGYLDRVQRWIKESF